MQCKFLSEAISLVYAHDEAVSHDIMMCIRYEGLLASHQLQKAGGVPRSSL